MWVHIIVALCGVALFVAASRIGRRTQEQVAWDMYMAWIADECSGHPPRVNRDHQAMAADINRALSEADGKEDFDLSARLASIAKAYNVRYTEGDENRENQQW